MRIYSNKSNTYKFYCPIEFHTSTIKSTKSVGVNVGVKVEIDYPMYKIYGENNSKNLGVIQG
jgi:hypothetical protein